MKQLQKLYTIFQKDKLFGISDPFNNIKVEPIYDSIEVKEVKLGCYLKLRLDNKWGVVFIPAHTRTALLSLKSSHSEVDINTFNRIESSIEWRFSTIFDAIHEQVDSLRLIHGEYELFFDFESNRLFTPFEWRREKHHRDLRAISKSSANYFAK
ncbi:MAG: hypothetical protein ACRC6V_19100 [Bacteroidales bacterium]